MRPILIGDIEFRPDQHELTSGAENIHLEPRVCHLLSYFLNNQSRLISHDELVNALWDGRVVSDDAIRGCVSKLRKALDCAGNNADIQTINKGGYMAVFQLREPSQIMSQPSPQYTPRRRADDQDGDNERVQLTVQVTAHQSDFISALLTEGKYLDGSEVIREALRLLENQVTQEQARAAAFKEALRLAKP